jgi:hypothetical protein
VGCATGLDLFESLAAAGEFSHDRVDGGRPDEGFRIFIPRRQEFVDGGNEIVNAEKGAAPDAFVGKFCKPAFDQIQPTATGSSASALR